MSFEVIAACCLANLVPIHALPDDHLERSVQVYVYPERIEIHYHLGLTDRQVGVELAGLDPSEPVPDDPAVALRRYEQLMAPRLAEQLRVSIDGTTLPVEICGIDHRARRHERFVVECEAPVRLGSKPRRIEVRDMTPPGAAAIECRRMALHGMQDVVVVECSGHPTLIRVPRQPGPARAYRPNEPSRTIVAVCRVPAATPATDAVAARRQQDEPAGNTAASANRDAPSSPPGDRMVAPSDSAPGPAGTPSVPTAATPRDQETGISRSTWLVAAGFALILAGGLFAAAAVSTSRRRRGPVPRDDREA